MESNKLDTLFKNKLERHQETVSTDAWAQVQNQLESNKKPFVNKWYVAASIALLALCTISYFIVKDNSADKTWNAQKVDIHNNYLALDQITQSTLKDIPNVYKLNKDEAIEVKKTFKEVTASKQYKVAISSKNTVDTRNEISLPKLTTRPASLNIEYSLAKNDTDIRKVEKDIVVKINFEPKQVSEFEQGKNKIKSLASELSIADLRAAKNELFASALSFDKRRLN